MRSVMSDRLFLLIQEHSFLQKDGINFLRLDRCKKPYEIIEIILLNVASKSGITWLNLLKTKPTEIEQYAELCVAIILIDRYLAEFFNIKEEERLDLVGYQFADILDAYYKNVNQK